MQADRQIPGQVSTITHTPPPPAEQTHTIHTIESAAHMLGLSIRTLGDRMRAGVLRAYKQAGRWYIFQTDLIEWIKTGRQSTQRLKTRTEQGQITEDMP